MQEHAATSTPDQKVLSSNIDTLDVESPEFKEQLRKAHEEANGAESSAEAQAHFIKLLNRVDPDAVVERMKLGYATNEQARKEYIKAMITTGHFDSFSLDKLLKRNDGEQQQQQQSGNTNSRGNWSDDKGTQKNPLYITSVSSWASILGTVISALIGGAILYVIFFRGSGGIGEGLLGKSNMTTPVEKSDTRFSDVMGAEEAKEELIDIVEFLKNPTKFARLQATLPKGVLLTGPPGCGKTLLARALAGEAGVPFFFCSGSEFEEMFVGVGASRVRKLFEKAKQMAPCVVFIDEIDAIGGRRDSPEARYHKMTLNQLLVELDGFQQHTGIVVVAATNLPDVLDPAVTRPGRFDRCVTLDLPDVKARQAILRLYLKDRAAPDVNPEALAKSTTGFSGAELNNMVNIAAIAATKRNLSKIPMSLMESAKDHVMMGPERRAMHITPNTKRITAIHESGHAIVGLYTPNGDNEIVKATLVPRGHALGMVAWQPNEELLASKQAYLARIDTAMGGRVAEEIMYGAENVTPGAGSDFQQATRIARAMVTQYGMSERLGKMAFTDEDLRHRRIGQRTEDIIEEEVRSILDQAYERAKNVLSDRRTELNLLADALLEYETLSLQEIKFLLAGNDLAPLIQQKRLEQLQLALEEQQMYAAETPNSH